MIKKKFFFVSKPSYVKQSWILIWTLVSSFGKRIKNEQKSSKKKFISPTCKSRMVKFTYRCTVGKTRKNIFKMLKILPTCNSFLKIDFPIELTCWWNSSFFTKNYIILLDSPICEKVPILFLPPLHTGGESSKKPEKKTNLGAKKPYSMLRVKGLSKNHVSGSLSNFDDFPDTYSV